MSKCVECSTCVNRHIHFPDMDDNEIYMQECLCDGEDYEEEAQKRGEKMDAIQSNIIARTVFKELQAFYANPENVKKFEEWKKKRKEIGGDDK